jgi:hypothetical protein
MAIRGFLLYCILSSCCLSCAHAELPATDHSWVERSNINASLVLDAVGRFDPEMASQFGIERLDTAVLDLRPGVAARYDRAAGAVLRVLAQRRSAESDPLVRQDLDILIDAVGRMRHIRALEERLLIPYADLPRQMFQGLQVLLDSRNSEARQRNALARLQRYAGLVAGTRPLTVLAQARMREHFDLPGRVWPYEGEVRQGLANCKIYVDGIAELLRARTVPDWQPAHAQLSAQVNEYCEWVRQAVLPRARKTPMLPRELYAARLREAGIDIEPEQAIAMGTFAFAEIRDQLNILAAQIARARGMPSGDYRDVLREIKRDAIAPERILDLYRGRLRDIEEIISRERLITLPQRPAAIRIASDAEAAAIPAPYMNAPRLIGNQGERGEFILPLRNPNATSSDPMNDFTSDAAAWALTAHEARPGHELQFSAMVERGVSVARAIFAFNSTNVEGWGLYAEAMVLPYFPLEGQLFALQLRLMRAARAFLDPMVNLGRMTGAAAKEFLVREVTLSEPLAQQEADRYAFQAPGQAVSYLYGYTRFRELRLKAELALGQRFDQRKFHDLVMAQGLLPPGLLERAVLEELKRSE